MRNIHLRSDEDLLRLIAEDDEDAFRVLFDRYKTRFYATAMEMTRSADKSEEIVQNALVSIWISRASLAKVNNPSAYLFTILYNQIYAQFKKTAAERTLMKRLNEISKKEESSAEEKYYEKEIRLFMGKLIEKLPFRQQQVYILSKHEGMSRNEIAQKLQLSPNTVKNHLFEAVKFMRSNIFKILSILISFFFLIR